MTKKEFNGQENVGNGAGAYTRIYVYITKKEAEKNINLFLESVEESLVKGDEVTFVGWGKWEVVERAAREVRSPQSKEIIKVPAKKAVKFKVGKLLADKIK